VVDTLPELSDTRVVSNAQLRDLVYREIDVLHLFGNLLYALGGNDRYLFLREKGVVDLLGADLHL